MNPHQVRRFRFSLQTLFVVMTAGVIAFFVGTQAGMYAVVAGAHGGSPWPTLWLSAPAFPFAHFIFGDSVLYVRCITIGTGVIYAIYAFLVTATRSLWVVLGVIGFHLVSVAALAIWVFYFLN